MLAPVATPLPVFPAVLFGLSGCLVDFGAQASSTFSAKHLPQRGPIAVPPADWAQATPGALDALKTLNQDGVPCAWIDELPESMCRSMAAPLKEWAIPAPRPGNGWPAPDACWMALMALGVTRLDGCVLISGEPRLLKSGLNAGLWTIGLASCGSLCGLSPMEWQALGNAERERRRGRATLELYALGVHSVIDHLGELESCLKDIALRRSKGEKP